MYENNSNVCLVNELEKFNERQGQQEQEGVVTSQYDNPQTREEVTSYNQLLATKVAALPEWLREARSAAIAKSK